MNVTVSVVQDIMVVSLVGELTSRTAPDAQKRILDAAGPSSKIILDFTQVPFMATAGFRLLLVVQQTIVGSGGKAVLVGLSEEIKDHLEATGFLDLYPHFVNVDAALTQMSGL